MLSKTKILIILFICSAAFSQPPVSPYPVWLDGKHIVEDDYGDISVSGGVWSVDANTITGTELLDSYLKIDGSNADTNINIGNFDFTTVGNITAANLNISNWDTAYGWGDHSSAGYAASGGAEHDGFSDFVANEHIDWTNTDQDLQTTGKGSFGNLDVDTLNLNGNVISDSTGTIDFDDENLTTTGTMDTTELFNSNGDLKIQPDVQGNVYLFTDTDVDNGADGKTFYIYRKAAEGDDYYKMYVDQWRRARLNANSGGDFLFTQIGNGKISIDAINNDMQLQRSAAGDATVFESSAAGEARTFKIYGYNSGYSKQYGSFQLADTGSNQVFEISSDTGIISFGGVIASGPTIQSGQDTDCVVNLFSDDGDDNADKWRFVIDTLQQTFKIQNYGSGAWSSELQLDHNSDYVRIPNVYENTTTFSANVFVNGAGSLKRSTSSVKYKNIIGDIPEGEADLINNLTPKKYTSKCKNDDPDKVYYGLTAEEVVSNWPELGVYDSTDPNESPELINYDTRGLIAVLVRITQKQQEQIDDLKESIKNLNSK